MANQNIFTTQVPSIPNVSDGVPYELGMKFRSAKGGKISAIRYWKAASETGTHVGKIWAATGGTPLASVTFSNETASGWQEQALSTPLNIQANTTYFVSVNCNSHFPISSNQLANSIVNGDLSSVADGNNGVFGNPNSLPSNSFRNSNYYRDIVFAAVSNIPTITKLSGDNQTGTAGNALPNPLVVQVNDGSGNPQSGVTINFAVTTGGGSVSPTSAVTNANGQASTVLTLGAASGATSPVTNTVSATASSIGSVSFTATANPSGGTNNQTIFTNQTPSIPDVSDGVPYELGMKFRSAKGGQIRAIRYWKAASETGNHVGKIWSSTGQNLASVNFLNETVSGWQQQLLNTPLAIEPNTTYVVSVNCNSYFPLTYDQLTNSIVNGDLSSVADGNNGVYGTTNTLPTNSYRNSNYFRDIVFLVGSSIIKVSGDNQIGTVGTALSNPLIVQVKDGAGNPQSGVTVNFAVTSGGGSVSPTSAVTAANGQASTVLTLGAIPSGPNDAAIVTATASGIGNTTFTAKAAPANSNAIYIENQNPGTTNWKITNYAYNEIVGYTAATSVNKGGSLDIKVSLAELGTYTIDVYRLGYYGGAGGRLILSSGSLNGITQPPYTVDSSTRLVECNWSTSYTLQIGSNWTSGLYIAKLTHQTGVQFPIWFVVRDDSRTADILFQASFNNYLAYTNTGGYSVYGFNSDFGQRAFKVSYDRPFYNGAGTNEYNTMTRWEYNMVRWLESQSYNVSYVTNVDVHANSQLLQRYKVFLSVGHDEYWSLEERNNVEQARDAGVNLGFFCANTAYWRVRLENSSTGTSNRIMACYKSDWAIDQVAAQNSANATNKFRGAQINRPENALLGVLYTGDKSSVLYGGFDFIVSNSSDPYYAHTNLNNGDSLGQLVGYEWDAVVNNGFTPSGLVILSQSPVIFETRAIDDEPSNQQTLPANTNFNISNAVRYTANSGAKVFSTGSIQFAFGLDSDTVPTPRTDIRVKQMVVNILADMNARPQTPDAGIIVP
jgi:hypothetical protein